MEVLSKVMRRSAASTFGLSGSGQAHRAQATHDNQVKVKCEESR